MKIQVAGFLDNSLVNGEGLRSVLFVSGCNHNCIGCHNKEMQDFHYGEGIKIEDILVRIKGNMPLIKGVTLSGGEPFEQARELFKLVKEIKKLGLNIWSYSGYTLEELLNSDDYYKVQLLNELDVLIDGKFDKDLKKASQSYIGSSNQRIINIKEYFKINTIIG